MNLFKKRIGLARAQFRGWSLYGAPWLQTVAIVGKSRSRGSRRNKRKPLRPVATRCLRSSMVSRASAVSCPPLREVPPAEEGVDFAGAAAVLYASRWPDTFTAARLCKI